MSVFSAALRNTSRALLQSTPTETRALNTTAVLFKQQVGQHDADWGTRGAPKSILQPGHPNPCYTTQRKTAPNATAQSGDAKGGDGDWGTYSAPKLVEQNRKRLIQHRAAFDHTRPPVSKAPKAG